MPEKPGTQSPPPRRDQDPPYRVYRSGRPDRPERSDREPRRPYTLYRSAPRGLRERLRGDQASAEALLDEERLVRPGRGSGHGSGDDGGRGGGGDDGGRGRGRPGRRWLRHRPITPWRVVRWVVGVFVAWLVLSLVLFLVSAQIQAGHNLPKAVRAALHSGPNMLTGTDTVLVLGLDQRPAGSKEPGAFAGGIRSDSIMLWRIGGGTSRRLSIPRDTIANIPGYGESKINAAYSYGGAALAIRTIEDFTGVTINHVIIVNLANFPKFINDVGGVNVRTGRICSTISGGVKNGGFSLSLKAGMHHLSGQQALTLARTRENTCDAASTDLTRDAYQQKILNSIKSQLLRPGIIPRLPWTAWDAPKTVDTDMNGFTLLQMFAAAEIGGSAPTDVLDPTSYATIGGQDGIVSTPADVRRHVQKLMTGH